jgi:protein-S-isoprenylcysteine O-methyltransferase Ste14
MPTARTLQFVLGYLVGGLLIVVLIPLGLWQASVAFDHVTGLYLISDAGLRAAVAVALVLVGLPLGVWSIVLQNTVGRGGPVELGGLEVTPKTQHLVVSGPYRYTRNPMLLGACVFYFGVAVYLDSIVAVAIVALFLAVMLAEVRLIEEPRLRRDFGEEYEEYRRRVPMFVPWPQRRRREWMAAEAAQGIDGRRGGAGNGWPQRRGRP